MMHRRRTGSSILDVFSLNPLPYPVLLFLAVIFIFLGLQWYVSYESMVETTGQNMGWLLLATPVVLVFLVRWLSSMEKPERLFWMSPYERRRRAYYCGPPEGSSPWGVAALLLLVLVLLQFQSTFLDSWFV